MFQIRQVPVRHVAGFHLVGPWERTVPKGFEQLMLWVKTHDIPAREWIAAYYGNPDIISPEKLACDTVVRVDDDFVVPPASEGVILTALAAGEYAVCRADVENNDFATPWRAFFQALLSEGNYRLAEKPCYEIYLNDGAQTGNWQIDMYIPVVESTSH